MFSGTLRQPRSVLAIRGRDAVPKGEVEIKTVAIAYQAYLLRF